MLLNSVQLLSSFPFEKIGVFLNNTEVPQISSRMGIRFRSNKWDGREEILNWGNLSFVQGGSYPDLAFSTTLSSYLDPLYTKAYTQPTNFIDIPGEFPLFFSASAIPDHDILLNFRGGLSSISIFPTRIYPIITKVSNNQITVSATVLPISAVDENWTSENYYSKVKLGSVTNLEAISGSVSYRNGYYSAHKRNFLWKYVTSNPLTNNVFADLPLPASAPLDKELIPASFRVSFPISATSLPTRFNYNLSYSNTISNKHFLSGLTIESYYSPTLSGFVTPLNPIAKSAFVTRNANGTSTLNVTLNTGYRIPTESAVTVYYDTSATQFDANVVDTQTSLNNWSLSSSEPAYFFNHQFDLSISAASSATSGYSRENAFTISYAPTAIMLPQTSLSSQLVSTVMIDNYFQTTFPIQVNASKLIVRFVESENDLTLSAVDTVTNRKYISNAWFPASALINFVNDGKANFHSVNFQVSGYNGSFYNYGPYNFLLNKDKAKLILTITNVEDNSATVAGNLFPLYDITKNVRWNVYPPENVVITDAISDTVLPLNGNTPANSLIVNLNRLGVDITTISLYTEEFDISATTAWIPPTGIYNNAGLALSGDINDFSPFSLSPFSALFVKNNLYYPVPESAYITWLETHNDPNGNMSFKTNSLTPIVENTIYASTRNLSNIRLNIASKKVPENPQTTTFNVRCKVFNSQYDLEQNQLIAIREYPLNANIYASMTASNGQRINTRESDNFFFTSAVTVTAVALTSDFSVLASNNIRWGIPPLGSTIIGPSAIFTLNESFCVTVSALSAKPAFGGFQYYHFSDTICISVFASGLSPFNYISFPEYKFDPTQHLTVTDGSYLSSAGLSGYKACNAQNFIISAFGGFDEYFYRIGMKTLSSTSNIATLSVKYSDVSAISSVSVSAFNSTFKKTNGLTVYNFASSNDSNIFRQHINFVEFPYMEAALTVTNNEFDITQTPSTFFDGTVSITPSGLTVFAATAVYVLSSTDYIKYSDSFSLNGNYTTISEQFTLNPEDFFSIDRNSNNVFNFFLTGNILKGIANFNICSIYQSFSSNIVVLSAYDGYDPDLEIFTKHHIHPTNETVYFSNETPDNFPERFDYFVFDDGAGHVQTVSSYTEALTGIYPTEGIYSVGLTGFYPTGRFITGFWENYIIAKDSYLAFDGNISRQFPDPLVFPYSREESYIEPNVWQFATSVNHSLNKLKTNFDYLSSMSTSFDITVPKYFVGWAAEKQGTLNWFYNTDFSATQEYSEEFGNLKDFFVTEDRIYLLNDNKLEIRNNDYNLTKIYSSDRITEGEVFQSPTKLVYNATLNKIIVLDNNKRFVYVFDVENDTPTLTHYWGGVGTATSRTKLNNPTDVHADTHTNILVVDANSLVVKIYNKFLNWTTNIEYDGWNSANRPISVASDEDEYHVLTETGYVYKFDSNYDFVTSFKAVVGTKIYTSDDNEGILYIVSGNNIYVYTKTGLFLNTLSLPNTIAPVSILFFEKELYILTQFSIIKVIDFLNTQTVKTGDYSLSAWNWNSIFIKNNEPVTDLVFNDSFKKIHDNAFLLGTDVTKKFVVKIDEFDNFVLQTLSAMNTEERCLSSQSYTPLGINELVSYETINRGIGDIYDNLDCLKNMLEVRYERLTGADICWTWKNLAIISPHNLTPFRKPFSWYELRSDVSVFNPLLSGITWNSMKTCCGETNSIPIVWTWESKECCSNPTLTWELMECERLYGASWESLESICEKSPNNYFDDCITVC